MNFQTVELFAMDLILPGTKEEDMRFLMNIVMIFRLNINRQFSEKQMKY
jgi:hypothetical protein